MDNNERLRRMLDLQRGAGFDQPVMQKTDPNKGISPSESVSYQQAYKQLMDDLAKRDREQSNIPQEVQRIPASKFPEIKKSISPVFNKSNQPAMESIDVEPMTLDQILEAQKKLKK